MALAMRVPWSHGYKNQFQVLSLMDYGTLEMSLCKLADNGESVLWMGAERARDDRTASESI